MSRSEHPADEPVVVIGSGPTGAMAAATLADRGVAVTVLDAGLRTPRGLIVRAAGNTVVRWRERDLLDDHRHDNADGDEVIWLTSRTLGGLSNYWTAAVPRFAPQDFTEGGAIDECFVWPVTYDELIPFYEVAEDALTITNGSSCSNVPPNVARYSTYPPTDWAEVVSKARRSAANIGPIPLAKGKPWMIATRGTEFASYHCVLAALVERGLVRLVRGAQVTSLEWSPARNRVTAIRYVDRASGDMRVQPVRAVVVAAGTVDSTTILLNSVSSDFPDGLGNAHGLVGRYLHDHPRQWWKAQSSRSMTALAHPLYISREPYESDNALRASSLTLGLAQSSHRLRTWVKGKVDTFGVQVFGTMVPRPEVGVSLSSRPSGDVLIRPLISLRYDQSALDTMAAAPRRLVETLALGGLDVTVPGPFHDIVPGSSVHLAGTIRMHSSPEHGVLDRWNRVHDAPNVLVVDSSCFTTGPEKNPTLTAMALATRAADHLADDLAATA